jgi:hypothetical protein
MLKYHDEIIKSYLEDLPHRPLACAVHGSVSRGTARKNSDIDLIMIRRSEDHKRIYKTQRIFSGFKIQAIVGAEEAFIKRMQRAKVTLDNFASHVVAGSIFVDGDATVYDRIKSCAFDIEELGAPSVRIDELASYAMRIHDGLDKLNSADDHRKIHIVFHLMRIIGFLVLRVHGHWLIPGAFSFETIRLCDPGFVDPLHQHLQTGLSGGSFTPFEEHVSKFVSSIGYPHWDNEYEVPI